MSRGGRRHSPYFFKYGQQLIFGHFQGQAAHVQVAFRHNYYLNCLWNQALVKPEKFPQNSFNSITCNGVAAFAADGQPHLPYRLGGIRLDKQDKMP